MNETVISNAPPDVPLTPPEEKKSSKTWLIILVVVLVLCCCCVCLSAFTGIAWTNGDRWLEGFGAVLPALSALL